MMHTPPRIVLLLAVTLGFVGCGSATALAAAPPRLLSNDNDGRTFRVRPATIVLGMAARITGPNVTLRDIRRGRHGHIRWSRWSRSEASGRGRAWISRAVRPYPAAIRAWRVRDGRYTRLWWSYTVGRRRHQSWENLIRDPFRRGRWTWRVTRFT